MVGPRPGKPGIDEGEEAWIAGTNYHLKLTREATMPWVEEKKGRVTRTFRCKGYFAGKGAQGADTLETPLSAVDATSLFGNDFYFGKPRKKQKQLFFFATCSMPGRGKSGLGRKGGEKAMAGWWQPPGLLVSMVGTHGDIGCLPPHHGEPFHTLTASQHWWCNASRPGSGN